MINLYHGIAIVGANGSGKTTLGKHLAGLIGYKHMDVEAYYFKESAIPYANPRTREEVQELMLTDIKKYNHFVLSSVNCDYGREINSFYNCVIYIKVPLDIRLERVRKRSVDKFGIRVLEGGDMYEQEHKFFDFVASRTMDKTDTWLQSIECPIIYIDGTETITKNAEMLKEKIKNLFNS